MESSTSDDGDPAASSFYFRAILLSFIFLATCSKPVHDSRKIALIAGDTLKQVGKTVLPPPIAKKPVKKKKKIYLTFDDGPNKGTQNVLDIVQQEQVPATFFIVGEHVFASYEQAKTWDSLQKAENIEICNHSYTHAHNRYEKFYQHPDTVVKDMEMTKEKLLPENNIVRAPGRNSWRIDSLHYTDIRKSKAAMDSLQAAGFIVMGWDLEWHYDPKTFVVKNNADELLNQVDSVFNNGKTKTADHLILLAHDQVYKKSTDSLELRLFVQKLKLKEDYELSLVSSYPGVARLVPDTTKMKHAISTISSP
jgi:peptidoglycan/xylan/chitin deacetylase (PgdA/CDA1 family)